MTIPHNSVLDGTAQCLTCAYWHKLTEVERQPAPPNSGGPLRLEGQCRIRRNAKATDGDYWCGEYQPDREHS